MGKYLLSITVLAVALDLIEFVSADRYKALTKACVGIILVMAIITPLPALIEKMQEDLDFSEIGDMQAEDIRISAFEDGIAQYISESFGLSRECVSVEAEGFNSDDMKAEKILITLTGSAVAANYKKIESVVNGLGLGEAEVKIEI